eukprot:6167138-Prymnesium_polylepis.1
MGTAVGNRAATFHEQEADGDTDRTATKKIGLTGRVDDGASRHEGHVAATTSRARQNGTPFVTDSILDQAACAHRENPVSDKYCTPAPIVGAPPWITCL